jgi:hypothetical protein
MLNNLLVNLFLLFSMISNPKNDVYIGGSKGYKFYYIPCKNGRVIVEILGIKYGRLDTLEVFSSKEGEKKQFLVAKSNHSSLNFNNDHFIYVDKILGLELKLKSSVYNHKVEKDRYKIFEINYIQKIGFDKADKRNYDDCLIEFEKYKLCD